VDEGRQFELTGAGAIGRDSSSTVRLFDTEVSRRHAELQPVAGGGFRVVDLASANGVFVNGQEVRSADLRNGDVIQVGKTVLMYSGLADATANAAADRVRILARPGDDLPSAIIRKIDPGEGSRLLTRADDVRSPWLRTRLANLAILYEATSAVHHIDDVDRLLEKMLELLFRSVEADRGCILLGEGDGSAMTPRAVRWRDGDTRRDEIALSRSIIDHVLTSGDGILVADAQGDDRFDAGQSIVRFGIREAICAPLDGRHGRIGVLYFDTFRTSRPGEQPTANRLTEDHLALALAVARQAALAVEESRYYRALVQSERLAAVGQAIAALSHHIKNLLQGVKSGCEVLKIGIAEHDDNAVRSGWKLLDKNHGRIYDLVMDMLSYSKDREPLTAPTDMQRLVRDAVDVVRARAAEGGVRMTVETAPLEPVMVDAEGIHRAVLNLLTNALDAVEESEAPQVNVELAAEPGDAWVTVRVRDNGVGIPPERLARLFRAFESTKGSRGTGLGLAVSRKTLREHGGDIVAESRPGGGSTFTIRIPARAADPGRTLSTPRPPDPSDR
jgi:signal transduction histidine kinase